MVRLRLLRVLLPGLLILLAFLLYFSWVPRSAVHTPRPRPAPDAGAQVAEIEFVEWEGERRAVAGDVEHLESRGDGGLHLEGIRNLAIHREDRGPLNVSAVRGDRQGEEGRRVWEFEDEVVFHDSDEGLRLRLPRLAVDEAAGEARSSGDITFSAPGFRGRAEALTYGLRGQPGSLGRPVIEDDGGGRLTAESARLLDGVRDIELIGDVRVLRGGERLDAGRMRLWRDADDRIRRVVARSGVWGSWAIGGGAVAHVRCDELEAHWNESGELERLRLTGDALLRRETQSLAAATIDAFRRAAGPPAPGWTVEAREDVLVQGMFGTAPGLLRTAALDAAFDERLLVESAHARDGVTFEGGQTRAEAAEAFYDAAAGPAAIRLRSTGPRKARLSHDRTRIAADEIVTDPRGTHLVAEGHVEASLLPQAGAAAAAPRLRLFAAEEAVHFVATRLESANGGGRLTFSGSVRGWQGERNLAAQHIVVDQQRNSLEATAQVATRIPREQGTLAVSQAAYVRIGAERLTYDDASGLAHYTGDVRMSLDEGWLEAQELEVLLARQTSQVHEVRAAGDVRLEFQRTAERALPRAISGDADRVVYEPADALVRLFGDSAPASVRRAGEGGDTTTGRVLAYRLDLGTLDVDAGEEGPARIRTAGG